MALRFDDERRTLTLSVGDLVETVARRGYAGTGGIQRPSTRLEQGRAAHLEWQSQRNDESYQAEQRISCELEVEGWRCFVGGRADGVDRSGGHVVVEEIKSSLMSGLPLVGTTREDWPSACAQLSLYVWMLSENGEQRVSGRLVLVSVLDGTRHAISVTPNLDEIHDRVRDRLGRLVLRRAARNEWMELRRNEVMVPPFDAWRHGQQEIAESVEWSLSDGQRVLVEAPTGLGKTAAVLTGALRHARATGKQVFWATARTTHQTPVIETLRRVRGRGVAVRGLAIVAKHSVRSRVGIDARPRGGGLFGAREYEGMDAEGLRTFFEQGVWSSEEMRALAESRDVCPFEWSLDASSDVDVVVGDYNYVFEPGVRIRRHFTVDPQRWVVVVDEAHHLAERARTWRSPHVCREHVRAAIDRLRTVDPVGFAVFLDVLQDIDASFGRVLKDARAPSRDGLSQITLPEHWLAEEARRAEELAIPYLVRTSRQPVVREGEDDPWVQVVRSLLRFREVSDAAEIDRVAVLRRTKTGPNIGLLCLDASEWLGAQIQRLGGFVGCSATLSPTPFHLRTMGLPENNTEVCAVQEPPGAQREVWVAPRVSTMFRDRTAHAPRTARLVEACLKEVPGNVAIYFSSYAKRDDIMSKVKVGQRCLLSQPRDLEASERDAWLAPLSTSETPVVLAAVLGGVFAEGIDLPHGALHAVFVVGPGFPPVGLERELLRSHYDAKYGEGHRYASQIPGLTRVTQAVGRLIRRPEDRGVVVLFGRRFRWREVQTLLPEAWGMQVAEDPASRIAQFFEDTQ